MSAQIIQKDGMAEYAVLPIDEYNMLLAKAEELDNVLAFDKAVHELESGQDELLPADIAKRLVGGKENRMKIWREYRGFTQEQLAEQAGISQGQVALIEGGKREGKVSVLKNLAKALNVELDDLV